MLLRMNPPSLLSLSHLPPSLYFPPPSISLFFYLSLFPSFPLLLLSISFPLLPSISHILSISLSFPPSSISSPLLSSLLFSPPSLYRSPSLFPSISLFPSLSLSLSFLPSLYIPSTSYLIRPILFLLASLLRK